MSSFEDRFLEGRDRIRVTKEYLHPNIEKAHRRTEQIFQREAIDIEAFKRDEKGRGVYSKEEVEADKSKAKSLKKRFREGETEVQKNLRLQAEVAEGLIYRGIGRYAWFGQKAKAIKTTEYDDYVNGVDVMVEFGDENQVPKNIMGLMVDITFSADRNIGGLDKKFERIKGEIEEGHLASVKYFQSRNTPRFRGTFSDMPRVIVGLERGKILNLATLWVNAEREEELEGHPVQSMILEQILVQLQAQSAYAKSIGNERLTEILEKEARIIEEILSLKKSPLGEYEFDEVHRQIIKTAKTFSTSVASPLPSRRRDDNRGKASPSDSLPKDGESRPKRPILSIKK